MVENSNMRDLLFKAVLLLSFSLFTFGIEKKRYSHFITTPHTHTKQCEEVITAKAIA